MSAPDFPKSISARFLRGTEKNFLKNSKYLLSPSPFPNRCALTEKVTPYIHLWSRKSILIDFYCIHFLNAKRTVPKKWAIKINNLLRIDTTIPNKSKSLPSFSCYILSGTLNNVWWYLRLKKKHPENKS